MDLSVIIPAYNREWSISATIRSVLECGERVEIIVVDDGSTDGTIEIARSFGERVIVLQQVNGGPAIARNTGFARATGSTIAFLDSDDIWRPGVVPECLSALRKCPQVDVLVCETMFGNDTVGYTPLSSSTGFGEAAELLAQPIGDGLFELPRDAFVQLMFERMQVFLGSTFIRRAALEKVGLFDPALFGGEDYELCLRLAARCRFAFLERPLAQYEKHPEGISTNPERMAREFALAVRSMVRTPDGLTESERQLARRKYAELGAWYAYRAYDRGDFAEARARFAAALREGSFSARTAAYWLACCLPGPAIQWLRRVKQGNAA